MQIYSALVARKSISETCVKVGRSLRSRRRDERAEVIKISEVSSGIVHTQSEAASALNEKKGGATERQR
jgi:hypothetical protein